MKKTFRILAATLLVSLSAISIALANPSGDGWVWMPPDDSREKQAIAETVRMQTHLNTLVSDILKTKIGG